MNALVNEPWKQLVAGGRISIYCAISRFCPPGPSVSLTESYAPQEYKAQTLNSSYAEESHELADFFVLSFRALFLKKFLDHPRTCGSVPIRRGLEAGVVFPA